MTKQNDRINIINEKQKDLTENWIEYWHQYSSFDTWQFWLQVILFFAPLIFLYYKIDKSKALQLGFYGFNIHVWLGYIDKFGINNALWQYPYQWMIFLANNVSLDASLIPVIFILMYQWILNNKKNYYLYMLLLSAGLSFIFKPLLNMHFFLKFYIDIPYIYLFLGYIVIFTLSKIITDIFVQLQRGN
ncbi:hypothetical protein FZC84_01460 [Rossellomorea vietnamensis]|uniref:Uncharacterized protein n=1 Tax=Rossellomorea vietnamensis TaxID=218284 RepID=A0A5D4MJ80_9BACI|nr:hypothetical protein [Rossellomorea vietnamensis]TYS01354.1 hypothetical protein FZC84_01460 [Rossellomorea vietnamensis]